MGTAPRMDGGLIPINVALAVSESLTLILRVMVNVWPPSPSHSGSNPATRSRQAAAT